MQPMSKLELVPKPLLLKLVVNIIETAHCDIVGKDRMSKPYTSPLTPCRIAMSVHESRVQASRHKSQNSNLRKPASVSTRGKCFVKQQYKVQMSRKKEAAWTCRHKRVTYPQRLIYTRLSHTCDRCSTMRNLRTGWH